CGTYAVNSEFEPWATGLPNQTSTQFFSISSGPNGSPCPGATRPFAPGFRAAGASHGAGAHSPFSVYLTRQDGDQTLATIVVTTAVSGPYDLGNVVNRVAVNVDPTTAAVTATSDPLPQIIEGIPLRIRSVLINLDRKDFTLNPTSCDPFQVTGILTGDQGAK